MAFQPRKPAAIGVKAPFPGFIEPALATSIEKVPTGKEALVEMTAQERVRAFSFHRPKCSHHPWKNGIFA